MNYIQGDILTTNGFEKGYLEIKNQIIIGQGLGNAPKKAVVSGIIVPSFINAHTHIGDAFIKNKKIKLPQDVEQLVAPPNGLKHRLLHSASDKEILSGMNKAIDEMIQSGTSWFFDFRENGLKGISYLQKAVETKNIKPIIFSRPNTQIYDNTEIDQLLQHSQGIGLSSISDWEYSEIQKIARHVKRKNKLFALHASEVIRENIDNILDLKPDILVHMVQATASDLQRVKDENIPIVLCPRSNNFFQLPLDINRLKQSRVDLLLGTDNAMINTSNVLDEVCFLKRSTKVFSSEELLTMVTYTPRKVLNLDDCIQGLNSLDNIIVLDKKTLKRKKIP